MSRRKAVRYDPANDLYVVLGIQATATADEIHRSFRLRAKEVHPDLNPDREEWAHAQFQRLNEAYDILNDAALRAEYDEKRRSFRILRDSDGVAWWDRPHPASAPRTPPPNPSATSAGGPVPPFSSGMRPRPPRRQPFSRDRTRPYQFLFIISFLVLVGSLCSTLTRTRVNVNEIPVNSIANAFTPTGVSSPEGVSPDASITCPNAEAMIAEPGYGAEVVGRFSIRGTAGGEHFSSYRVDIRSYDVPSTGTEPLPMWFPLTIGQGVNEPVDHGILVPETATTGLPPGNYILRLLVRLDDGTTLPCWVPILKSR